MGQMKSFFELWKFGNYTTITEGAKNVSLASS